MTFVPLETFPIKKDVTVQLGHLSDWQEVCNFAASPNHSNYVIKRTNGEIVVAIQERGCRKEYLDASLLLNARCDSAIFRNVILYIHFAQR